MTGQKEKLTVGALGEEALGRLDVAMGAVSEREKEGKTAEMSLLLLLEEIDGKALLIKNYLESLFTKRYPDINLEVEVKQTEENMESGDLLTVSVDGYGRIFEKEFIRKDQLIKTKKRYDNQMSSGYLGALEALIEKANIDRAVTVESIISEITDKLLG
jgi:hypothetical protein